ncbi:MAG: methyltransferase domain-containing protein [Thermoplasmatota archaeon]
MYYRQLFDYNSKLVDEVLKRIPRSVFRRVIEFGAGSGIFTLPLLERVYEGVDDYIVIDPYPGPYAKDRESLVKRVRDEGFQAKFHVHKTTIWDAGVELAGADLVIGHDVFCDLTMDQVKRSMKAGRRLLSEGGYFVHSGLCPNAATPSERLLVKLDSYSSTPLVKGNWFSPGSEFLFVISREAGYEDVGIHEVKVPLTLTGSGARALLKEWNIKDSAIRRYGEQIDRIGIEFPREQVLICRR